HIAIMIPEVIPHEGRREHLMLEARLSQYSLDPLDRRLIVAEEIVVVDLLPASPPKILLRHERDEPKRMLAHAERRHQRFNNAQPAGGARGGVFVKDLLDGHSRFVALVRGVPELAERMIPPRDDVDDPRAVARRQRALEPGP